MPSKKKRIATRQAQLSQRRRRERNRGRRTDDETGPGVAPVDGCHLADLDRDWDVDLAYFVRFQAQFFDEW